MTKRNRPKGYPSVTPYIFADDPAGLADFLTKAFDANELGRSEMPDGTIANCQLQIADSILMIAQARGNYPATKSAFYLYVDDVDAVMTSAIGLGAKLEFEAMGMPYGDYQGGLRGPENNLWWVSRRTSDTPYF